MPLFNPPFDITGTPEQVAVFDSSGDLGDGPSGVYRLTADALSDLYLAWNLEAGGAGAIGVLYAEAPLTPGQDGFALGILAGPGANGLGATPGGDGGLYEGYGGFGGDGTAAAAAGAGGEVQIASAPPGANNGGGGNRAGDVYIDGSDGTGAGRAGDVLLGTYTPGVYGTRYVRVGPDGASIPLLIDRSAPVGSELLNVRSDTDALSILGRTAIGSWVASDEVDIAHYDNRASATGYLIRGNATNGLFNAPQAGAGVLYLQNGGSFANGLTIGDGVGTAHVRPLTTASLDLGSASLKFRDLYLSRDAYVGDDIEFLASVDHDIYVATATGNGGGINVIAANGVTNGNGGSVFVYGGDSVSSSPATNRTGGAIALLAGDGSGDGGTGGPVSIQGGEGNDEDGTIEIGTENDSIIYIGGLAGTFVSTLSLFGGVGTTQWAAIANADGTLADITTKFNTLLGYLRDRGDLDT